MPDDTKPTPDPTRRIAELEAEVKRLERERNIYAADAHKYRLQFLDEMPTITEAEAVEMMSAPQSDVLIETIIAEYEALGDEP